MASQLDDAPVETRRDQAGESASATAARDGDFAVVTIARPIAEVRTFAGNPSNWSRFMKDVVSIEPRGALADWVARSGNGDVVRWETRLTSEANDSDKIRWESTQGQPVDSRGVLTFVDAGQRGTIVSGAIVHRGSGMVGKLTAALFLNDALVQARRDLRRLKQLMETGEIATSARNRAQAAAQGEG